TIRDPTGHWAGLGRGPACRERCTRPHATLTRNARRHLRQVVGEAFRGLAAGGRDCDRAPAPYSRLSGARRLSRRAVYRRCVDRRRAGVAREYLRLHAAGPGTPEVQEVREELVEASRHHEPASGEALPRARAPV